MVLLGDESGRGGPFVELLQAEVELEGRREEERSVKKNKAMNASFRSPSFSQNGL